MGSDSGWSETIAVGAGFIAVTIVELLAIIGLADFVTCSEHLIG